MTDQYEEELKKKLSQLPPAARQLLSDHRFDAQWLASQAQLSRSGKRSNLVSGELSLPASGDVVSVPSVGQAGYDEMRELGENALREGRCALVVLAGGMATRMGGVVKALVPALGEATFLDLRLNEQAALSKTYGKCPPLWLMTSHATHQGIKDALGEKLQRPSLALFKQGLSVRLDEQGSVFFTEAGEPSLHAPGHGDLPDSLKNSELLEDFVAGGGKYVLVTNLDNLGGGLDPVLIGMHLKSSAAVTCEVVDKVGSDRGGIPVRLDGKPVVLEEFRIPSTFDPQTVPVFNVNSFAFGANELRSLKLDWTYFEVKKKVEGRTAIQYERLINEVTFALPTQYVRVPRSGPCGRFLPVKDHDELKRRQPELKELALARGMIEPPHL